MLKISLCLLVIVAITNAVLQPQFSRLRTRVRVQPARSGRQEVAAADTTEQHSGYEPSGWKPDGPGLELPNETKQPDNAYGPPDTTYGPPDNTYGPPPQSDDDVTPALNNNEEPELQDEADDGSIAIANAVENGQYRIRDGRLRSTVFVANPRPQIRARFRVQPAEVLTSPEFIFRQRAFSVLENFPNF